MIGGVCSGIVKYTQDTIITFGINIHKGRYRCTDFVQWAYDNPIVMLKDVVEEVQGGYLLAKPYCMAEGKQRFSGTRVVEEMHGMLEQLSGAWWGRMRCTQGSRERKEMIDNLQQQEAHQRNPVATVCNINDDLHGYLFEIVTAQDKVYKVTFDSSGFTLTNTTGPPIRFPTMKDIIQHMITVEHMTFATRPCATLQERCRRVITGNKEYLQVLDMDTAVPQCIKDYVKGEPRYDEYW